MEIRQLDPQDKALVRRHWEIGRAAEANRPYDLYWPWESAWVTHSEGRTGTRTVLLGAFEGDTMWGAGQVDHPLLDNTHSAFAEFFVHPDRQRQGVGRALVDAGWAGVLEAGRRVMMTEVFAPPAEPSPGLLFAAALGFTVGIEEELKALDLDETEHLWDELDERTAPYLRGYRLVTAHDAIPDELVAGYCRISESFVEEAPMGELDVEPEKWDEKRVRDREERNARSGRHVVMTLAVAGDGQVAGVTEVQLNDNVDWRGMQGGTIVLPGHRGHRLGLAMKVQNQRAVRERSPRVRILITGNAGVNAPMNAVNDALGYRSYERCIEMQKSR